MHSSSSSIVWVRQFTLVNGIGQRVGPTVFLWKFCQIPWARSQISMVHCSNSVQIQQLTTASHLWLKTERAVEKLQLVQLLNAGIVPRYVSNINRNHFFLFKSAMKFMSHNVSSSENFWRTHVMTNSSVTHFWQKWVTDESVITHHASDRTNHWSFLKFCKILPKCYNSAAKGKFHFSAQNSAAHGVSPSSVQWV